MKNVIGLLIGILLSLNCLAQDVPVPSSVLANIIDELIVKDGMEVKLKLQDSIITVYERRDSTHLAVIAEFKLNEKDYRKVIQDLKDLNIISEAENRDLKKEFRRTRRRLILTNIAWGAITLLILL